MLHIENIENLELLNVIQGISALHAEYVDRPSHALIFKLSGESVYTFPQRTISLAQGEMLFIPQGSAYTVHRVCSDESRYVLVNFRAGLPAPKAEKYRLSDQVDFAHLCARLGKYRVVDTPADRCRLLSLFYESLACAAESERSAYTHSTTARRIEPALAYLRENLFDPGLKIGRLHRLCGISDTYFRRLFIARFGVSPKKYVLNRRLVQAKAILDTGEYNSVSEAALLSGFDDALYFSRVFKRTYGYPPSGAPDRPGT